MELRIIKSCRTRTSLVEAFKGANLLLLQLYFGLLDWSDASKRRFLDVFEFAHLIEHHIPGVSEESSGQGWLRLLSLYIFSLGLELSLRLLKPLESLLPVPLCRGEFLIRMRNIRVDGGRRFAISCLGMAPPSHVVLNVTALVS